MAFHPFEVNAVHLTYTILGGFIVLFGMFSLFIKERAYVGEAVLATIVGIIAGPYVTGGFDPRSWGGAHHEVTNEITLEVTRVVIAISVFAVGVELPKAYMRKHWKSLAFLLGPVMVFGWFVTAALIYAIIPGLSFLSSLCIAACVTPTDPILAQAVIGGKFADKHVPAHLRHLLAAESGCNDGAAFPFLYIAIYLILDASDAHAVGEWFYVTWLYEVALGIVLGALIGYAARRLMKFCEQHSLIDRQSFVAQYISLAVLAIGVTTLLGSDDLLAAFACGTAFAWDGFFNKQTEESNFSNVIDLLFNVTAFIYIGAILPFSEFSNPMTTLSVWRLIVLMLCVMVLRRLPIMIALYKFIPDIHTFREALFTGHFGPIGVGAIFISTLAATKLPEYEMPPRNQVELLAATIQPIVHFFVLCSVLIHGLSIPFFSLGRRVHSIHRTHSVMMTRTRTNDSRGGDRMQRPEPAWLSGMRRIVPGVDVIRINRDDDPMDGMERGPMDRDDREKAENEKVGLGGGGARRRHAGGAREDDSGSGSGSSTARDDESGDKAQEKTQRQMEEEGDREEAEESDEERRLEATGRKTPPIREFREGNHLIIERSTSQDGGDVEVEVIRNKYHKTKPEESDHFKGSHDEVRGQIRAHFENLKDEAHELGHDFMEFVGHLGETEEQRDRRHDEKDEREERAADEAAAEVSRDGAQTPPRRTGLGVPLTRSVRIYGEDDDEEASSDEEEETAVAEPPRTSRGSASVDFANLPPKRTKSKSDKAKKGNPLKKFFGGSSAAIGPTSMGVASSSSPDADSSDGLALPLASSRGRVPSATSSMQRTRSRSRSPPPSVSITAPQASSIRFADSPLALSPAPTIPSSSSPSAAHPLSRDSSTQSGVPRSRTLGAPLSAEDDLDVRRVPSIGGGLLQSPGGVRDFGSVSFGPNT